MDAKTLEALKGSIAKWEAIVAGTGEDLGPVNCPLCLMFNKEPKRCFGCPVFAETGEQFCYGTPFSNFQEAEDNGEVEEAADLAKAELEFLKSLLPALD